MHQFSADAVTAKFRKLQHKATKKAINLTYQQALADNPKLRSNLISRFMQKQKIKRQYAKMAREAKRAGKAAKKTAVTTEKIAKAVVGFIRRQELYRLEVAVAKLYEDRVCGVISDETFSDLISSIEADRLEKERRLSLLEQTEQETAAKVADIQLWMRNIRMYAAADHVDREMLESLVDKIEIGERRSAADGRDHQEIRIFYCFVGLLQ